MSKIERDRGRAGVAFQELGRAEVSRSASEVLSLLRQLRPKLSERTFRELTSEGYAQGLRYLLARSASGKPLAAVGYRILVTSRGRILYVDDLVTAEAERSRGTATAVMNEIRQRAHDARCALLELDSGVTNTTAHRFYLRNRLDIRALHFCAAVDP